MAAGGGAGRGGGEGEGGRTFSSLSSSCSTTFILGRLLASAGSREFAPGDAEASDMETAAGVSSLPKPWLSLA